MRNPMNAWCGTLSNGRQGDGDGRANDGSQCSTDGGTVLRGGPRHHPRLGGGERAPDAAILAPRTPRRAALWAPDGRGPAAMGAPAGDRGPPLPRGPGPGNP